MIRAGSLKEIISIKTPTREPNDSGGSDTVYNEILNTFASVKEMNVSNDLIASQSNIIQMFEFKMYYRQDVTISIGDKIDWRGRRFTIDGFKGGFLNRSFQYIIGKTENESTDNGETTT